MNPGALGQLRGIFHVNYLNILRRPDPVVAAATWKHYGVRW